MDKYKWRIVHEEIINNDTYYVVELLKKRWYGWEIIKYNEGNNLTLIKETFNNLINLLSLPNKTFMI